LIELQKIFCRADLNSALTIHPAKSAYADLMRLCAAASLRSDQMPVSDVPILSMLRTRMQWHQERQRVLAENVANSDTPRFQPRDLKELSLDKGSGGGSIALASTNPAHLSGGGATQFQTSRAPIVETHPGGNGVNIEDEMMKVAQNQMDYQAATALYSRGLGLIKRALGK
jgi:flagellar basal-body rod protein FlgB